MVSRKQLTDEQETAYHEAGHAVAAYYFGLEEVELSTRKGLTFFRWKPNGGPDEATKYLLVSMSGPCAHGMAKRGGVPYTRCPADPWTTYGGGLENDGESDAGQVAAYFRKHYPDQTPEERASMIRKLWVAASEILYLYWKSVEKVARHMTSLGFKELNSEQLSFLLSSPPPVRDEIDDLVDTF